MLTIKQGDNRNAIKATLTKNGNPVDLTDCNVYISISSKIYEAECSIDNGPEGEVFYPLDIEITCSTGIYNYEFIVKYKDGREETFPNDGYLKLNVMREIKGVD